MEHISSLQETIKSPFQSQITLIPALTCYWTIAINKEIL